MNSVNSTTDLYSCVDGRGIQHTSITTEYWDNEDTPQRLSALISASVTLCFILVGAPANLLIIVSILWQHLYKQPTYILLLNLAIADLLVCVLIMPFTVISGFAGGFRFGSTDVTRCKLCQLGILYTFSALFTIHILALLSIDRFMFIKYALKYHKLVTCKVYMVVCICVWLICLALSLPPLFGFGDVTFGIHLSTCGIKFYGSTTITWNLNYAIFIALEIAIPVSVTIITTVWILCIIQKQMRKVYAQRSELEANRETFRTAMKTKIQNTKSRKQLQLIKVFGAIFISNFITWLPVFIRAFITLNAKNDFAPGWFALYAFLSSTSYPVVHSILEATLIPELRRTLTSFIYRKLFCSLKYTRGYSSNKFKMTCKDCRSLECLDVLNSSLLPDSGESTISK